MPAIYSIGHSTRSFEEFAALLDEYHIELLADIRRFPGSRKYPQFNQDTLKTALAPRHIAYVHFQQLGGRRRTARGDSPNGGLRNQSFRAYGDYMQTEEFKQAIEQLLACAGERPTALMCAEAVYWRCHRRLVSDYLYATGDITVEHILRKGQLREHRLTDAAQIENKRLSYPPPLWQ